MLLLNRWCRLKSLHDQSLENIRASAGETPERIRALVADSVRVADQLELVRRASTGDAYAFTRLAIQEHGPMIDFDFVSCGQCQATYRPSQWQDLKLVGYQKIDDETLELRNCPCGSTLAKEVIPAD